MAKMTRLSGVVKMNTKWASPPHDRRTAEEPAVPRAQVSRHGKCRAPVEGEGERAPCARAEGEGDHGGAPSAFRTRRTGCGRAATWRARFAEHLSRNALPIALSSAWSGAVTGMDLAVVALGRGHFAQILNM